MGKAAFAQHDRHARGLSSSGLDAGERPPACGHRRLSALDAWKLNAFSSSFRGARSASPATVLAVKGLRFIRSVIFDKRVGGDEQLSGNGNEGELSGLSLVPQRLIGKLHLRIVTACHQSGHVEGGADTGSASGDGCAWRRIAGLADVRSKAGETGD